MSPFEYTRATEVSGALAAISTRGGNGDGPKFIAGGTNLIDLMKENVERPTRLVDVTRLPLTEITPTAAGGLRIGALVTNSQAAYHPEVLRRYPLLSKAILAGASAQLRNMATMGGNLLQRTRCYYFYDTATPCHKRQPGSGCGAIGGYNRIHAILGASEQCIATNPSDMNVALAALEATVRVTGPAGERTIAMADFHRLPGNEPWRDSNLRADEIITAVDLPPRGFAEHSVYLKTRDRASYAFALVSAAVGLEMEGDTVREARLALGGVAHKPWREVAAEEMLRGQPATQANFQRVADFIVRDARSQGSNDFKIELARRVIVRAFKQALDGQ